MSHSAEKPSAPEQHRVLPLAKVLLVLVLLTFLLARIGLEEIGTVLATLDPLWFLLIYALLAGDALLRSWNWGALLASLGHRLSLRELFGNYMIGGFLGTFIPSSLGTDLSRAVLAARRNGVGAQDSALVMLVLNLVGLLALCLIALLSIRPLLRVQEDTVLVWLIVPACLVFVAVFPLLLRGWMPDYPSLQLPLLQKLLARIREFSTAMRTLRNKKVLIRVLSVALLSQLLAIVLIYTISVALGTQIPFLYFLAFVPIITLSRLIPLSIAGLGAEQGVFVLLFAQAGVPAAEAFLISLILSVTNLTFTLVGGGIYALENVGKLRNREGLPR
jgi:glycosyltransferase 2 family protein